MSAPATSSGVKSASGVILAGPANLRSVMVTTDGTNAATVLVYDNASAASGTVVCTMKVPGATLFNQFDSSEGIIANAGLYISIAGTGAQAVVTYEAT